MALLGARALIDIAVPTGVDGSEILKFELKDGRTAQQVIAESAALIGDVNSQVAALYGGITYMTERIWAQNANGESARSQTPRKSEFKRADGVRASTIGHMFPINDFEDAVEWTPLYLRDANAEQITADLQLIADRWRNRVDLDIWTRALTNTENAIGSAGYDVGWAIGTGTSVNFIPPQYGATIFSSSHTHFQYFDDSTLDYDDMVEAMMGEMRHHGFTGMLSLFVAQADVAEYTAFTSAGLFVPLQAPQFTVIAGSTSAPVRIASGELTGIPGDIIGYWQSPAYGLAEIRTNARIPTDYAFLTKSFGANNPRNGLAIRTHPRGGFGLVVDPQVTNSVNPELDFVLFKATHGIGVNDRLNGVAGYIHASANAWVNPTIS